MSSNLRELKADVKTATHFIQKFDIRNTVIAVLSDNSTSTFYINKHGGRVQNLDSITKTFVEQCLLRRNVLVRVYHTPGQDIIEMGVDGYSRGKNPLFKLSSALLDRIRKARVNTRIALPLFKEIGTCLHQIVQTKDRAVVVTPVFPNRPWWQTILQMSTSLPIVIMKHKENLRVEESEQQNTRRFLLRQDLLAWSVCWKIRKTHICHQTLSEHNWLQQEQIKEKFTIFHGKGGYSSARVTRTLPQRLVSVLSGIYRSLNSQRS
jgi:hypothetical protein